MGLFGLLRKFLTQGRAAAVSSIIMAAYVIVAGAGVSAVRAFIMFLISLGGTLTGRIYDMKNAIAIAAIVIIAGNPYYLFNKSFLLSFSSVAAIAFVLPCVIEFLEAENKAVKAFITSITVNFVNGPIIANTYFELPLYSTLLNIIVVPLMSVVVICGFFGIAAGQLWALAGTAIIYPAVLIIRFYELLCSLAERLPFSKIVTGHFEIWQFLLYYGIMALIVYGMYTASKGDRIIIKKVKGYVKGIICGFAGLAAGISLYAAFPKRNVITFLDVGQGDCSVFVSGDGMVCIFDAGSTSRDKCGTYNILPYLKYSGIDHVDYIILSHSDADHINGVEEILEDGAIAVNNIIVSAADEGFGELISKVGEEINIIYGSEGMYIEDSSARITFLNPAVASIDGSAEAEGDVNEASIVALIETNGIKAVMTGDIGSETEAVLVEKYSGSYNNSDGKSGYGDNGCENNSYENNSYENNSYENNSCENNSYENNNYENSSYGNGSCENSNYNNDVLSDKYGKLTDADILKVPHHGSKNSSSECFLELLSPRLSIVSCGEDNSYGHPHREALDRLELYSENVEITYQTGAVTVYLDNSDTLTYDIFREK